MNRLGDQVAGERVDATARSTGYPAVVARRHARRPAQQVRSAGKVGRLLDGIASARVRLPVRMRRAAEPQDAGQRDGPVRLVTGVSLP